MTSPVRSVTFNQTENWVGAGSKSGGVKIFDLDENKGMYVHVINGVLITCSCIHPSDALHYAHVHASSCTIS